MPDSHHVPLFMSPDDFDEALDAVRFEALEPPLGDEDYLFSLDNYEGVMDLFDMNGIPI